MLRQGGHGSLQRDVITTSHVFPLRVVLLVGQTARTVRRLSLHEQNWLYVIRSSCPVSTLRERTPATGVSATEWRPRTWTLASTSHAGLHTLKTRVWHHSAFGPYVSLCDHYTGYDAVYSAFLRAKLLNKTWDLSLRLPSLSSGLVQYLLRCIERSHYIENTELVPNSSPSECSQNCSLPPRMTPTPRYEALMAPVFWPYIHVKVVTTGYLRLYASLMEYCIQRRLKG